MRAALLALSLSLLAFAGCLDDGKTDAPDPVADPTFPYIEGGNVHYERETPSGLLHMDWAPGGAGKVWNKGNDTMTVALPEHWLTTSEQNGGTLSLERTVELGPGEKAFLLAPPSAHEAHIDVGDEHVMFQPALDGIDLNATTPVVDGRNVWDLMDLQRREYPNRTPGEENYGRAIDYFAGFFEDLGYEVEVDPYGTQDLTDAAGCSPVGLNSLCPESLANIVATKPGSDPTARTLFVGGGHYDVVPGTTEGAFDDTSGTIMTLELARALAPFEFGHTLKFGLWGGEENGILGSQFWIQSNPQARAEVLSYWNLDVVGMSWPAPVVKPDPLMIAAGPDAPAQGEDGGTADPVSQDLLDWARTLQTDWFDYPDAVTAELDGSTYPVFLYEGVASGQVSGYAGVNAQSDHTPFMAAGIPSYFVFNADALNVQPALHTERDTLQNMTKYALFENEFDPDQPGWFSEEEKQAGIDVFARSMEATMMFPLYHAMLVELGVYDPPTDVV